MILARLSLLVIAGLLAGCATSGDNKSARHLAPLTAETARELQAQGMVASSPMLVRIYKKESELEVWKQAQDGRYKKFKTYKICKWSGTLGPKIKEGDKQAPEGFYAVTPAQMNPNSNYYLSFNIGFPNVYDRAHGRTGKHLMVHGDCLSAGCYAMTDDQMKEIYSLARESFAGGQAAFQLQAFPFRMTPRNLAKHRTDPNMAFWKNLKQGSDHFEVARAEPRVAVCNGQYVFNPDAGVTNASFSPNGRCPSFAVSEGISTAVAEKQKKDDAEIQVAAVEIAEEEKDAIEAAKPNTFLSTVAKASGASKDAVTIQAEMPAASAKEEPKAEPRTAAKKGQDKDEPSEKRVAETGEPIVAKKAEEDPPGTGIGRFLAKMVGQDDEPGEPEANPQPQPEAKPKK